MALSSRLLQARMLARLVVQRGRITLKAGAAALLETIFGPRRDVNAEQPYMESYGK